MIVTNATVTSAFTKIAQWPHSLTGHLFFKFSYHYMQLKERNLLDVFFNNVCLMRDVGCSFTLEATPSDEMIPYSDEMIQKAIEYVGAMNHITVARDERNPNELPILTELSPEEYTMTWNKFHSELFTYKMSIFGQKRNEFCYAGAWSLYLNFQTGDATQCYSSFFKQNIFSNPKDEIKWMPIGNNCKEMHCYNGHAFLVLGLIPELKTPNYAELRNRKSKDGTEWLQPEMKAFMQTKLYESNEEYTPWQKIKANYEMAKLLYQQNLNCNE